MEFQRYEKSTERVEENKMVGEGNQAQSENQMELVNFVIKEAGNRVIYTKKKIRKFNIINQ